MPFKKILVALSIMFSGAFVMLPLTAGLSTVASGSTGEVGAPFTYTRSSGLFLLPRDSGSVVFSVLNNTGSTQSVAVTIFRCPVTADAKTPLGFGTLNLSVEANRISHHAYSVGTGYGYGFNVGRYYEVVVQSNDLRVLPMAAIVHQLASGAETHGGAIIPGTLIPAADFVRIQ